jgi:hypothetical protein
MDGKIPFAKSFFCLVTDMGEAPYRRNGPTNASGAEAIVKEAIPVRTQWLGDAHGGILGVTYR